MINITECKIFNDNIATLKETSKDDANNAYLTDSLFNAIDFDAVKEQYIFANSTCTTSELRSNDALVIFDGSKGFFIFIEFKNGEVTSKSKREEIRSKISESLLIVNDILNENLTFDRKNINYILVYNKSKNTSFENQRFSSLTGIASLIGKSANMTYLINGFDRYKAFFHDVKTINEDEFKIIKTSLENSTYTF